MGTPFGELLINPNASGRAAMVFDNTGMQGGADGAFVPANIPASGEPFFGSRERASIQGSGTNVSFAGQILTTNNNRFQFYSSLFARNLAASTNGVASSPTFSVQQIYVHYNRFLVGQSETGLATIDNSALPETLDIGGPNGRITVFSNTTTGPGQGRLSYFFYNTNQERSGLTAFISAEQATSEITASNPNLGMTRNFSRCPDFIGTVRYGSGQGVRDQYVETWHLQLASIGRSLGVENATRTLDQTVGGWGISVSGAYRFFLNPRLVVRDGIFFSSTYGQGLGHYIYDLHGLNADAALNASNALVALPAFATYAGYTHNWTDYLRSTLTYSHVTLNSINSPGQTLSPYHFGDYVALNLLYHNIFFVQGDNTATPHTFYTGMEVLYGQKQNLNGAEGEAYRAMWVVAFSS